MVVLAPIEESERQVATVIGVEEPEARHLGDREAALAVYPKFLSNVLGNERPPVAAEHIRSGVALRPRGGEMPRPAGPPREIRRTKRGKA